MRGGTRSEKRTHRISEFLESKPREPKFLDFETEKFHTVTFQTSQNILSIYVEFFQNSTLASTRAVFERDIIVFLAKVIYEASGAMELDPIQ